MNQFDASYRRLFGTRAIVRDLLCLPWIKPLTQTLNLQTLEPLPTDLISRQHDDRQVDLLWQIQAQDGQSTYVQVQIEHQSRPERDMALRMLTYRGLLYEAFRRGQRHRGQLPALIPIVLYSGTRPWRAALQVRELIAPVDKVLEPYQPALKYFLIDQQQLVRDPQLQNMAELPGNLAWLQFRLEHNSGAQDTKQLLSEVARLAQGTDAEPVQDAFASWVRLVLLKRALPNNPDIHSLPALSLPEMINMMTDGSRNWHLQWKREGLAEGRAEGRTEGRMEGRRQQLEKMLLKRFGVLDPQIKALLQGASETELDRWALNLLDASTVGQVFDH